MKGLRAKNLHSLYRALCFPTALGMVSLRRVRESVSYLSQSSSDLVFSAVVRPKIFFKIGLYH